MPEDGAAPAQAWRRSCPDARAARAQVDRRSRLPPPSGPGYPVPMPRTSKLKVFRLPIGFHDAYVAAPSQKAAAEAWGSDIAVFTRGEAELVTDPTLSKEPLASPGKVIKRLRGTAEEQIAALGPAETPKARKGAAPARKKTPPPKPRPSRAALDEAEAALAAAEAAQAEARRELTEREAALARERAALEKKSREERERLEARRDRAEAAYQEALRRWRG